MCTKETGKRVLFKFLKHPRTTHMKCKPILRHIPGSLFIFLPIAQLNSSRESDSKEMVYLRPTSLVLHHSTGPPCCHSPWMRACLLLKTFGGMASASLVPKHPGLLARTADVCLTNTTPLTAKTSSNSLVPNKARKCWVLSSRRP